MRTLGLIPARGGSKGIPRKNLRQVGGVPLLERTIREARAAGCLTDILVSTDDPEIAASAIEAGAQVPFQRAPELATDFAATIDVAIDTLQRLKASGRVYDIVVLLQPTSPLRTAGDIAAAVQLMASGDTDSVVSVSPVGPFHPYYCYEIRDGALVPVMTIPEGLRRQEFPAVYVRNGAIYATRTEVVLAGSFYGSSSKPFVMPRQRSLNIDDPEDLRLAELMLGGEPTEARE